MPDPAITKVEDALAQRIANRPFFAGYSIVTDQSADIALEEGSDNTLLISVVSYSFNVADENWKALHTATIEIESVKQNQVFSTINRENREVMAEIVAAIGDDRTWGGMIQDVQELDVAPADATGRGVAAVTIQIRVQFFTPLNDHFTILGLGSQTF